MRALARLVQNRTTAWGVVAVVCLLTALAVTSALKVEQEDDLLAFLPRDNPEVEVFTDINRQFGGLDVALVGLKPPDVFAPDFLRRLRQVTQELEETQGLDHVLSLANVVDFTPNEEQGGVVTSRLVQRIPANPAESAALRQKVMSRDHLVGNLVSADGEAVLVYCYLAYGTDPKDMSARIQETVRGSLPNVAHFWGGGPFISSYIYNVTQEDMRRLTPWAVIAIVSIMVLAFRDLVGSLLAIISTAAGTALSLGLMGLLGVKFNIVLSSMPVILFAVGSAYAIHVLARYYALRQQLDSEEAIGQAIMSVGPVVLAAGLTTAAGLLSFVFMDITPIRTFGLFTAAGILCTLVLSLTFVPALVRLLGLRARRSGTGLGRQALVRFSTFSQRHRLPVGIALGLLALGGITLTARVDTRMDQSTFFSAGSPPDRAERFLTEQFGGSQFIQIHVRGDMNDPHVLRELRRLADRAALLPHVSSVQHLGTAMAQVNHVMTGHQRIPDRADQVKLLYAWLAGDPSVAQLVTSDREQGLLHIKVGSNQAADLEVVLDRLEQMISSEAVARYQVLPAGSASARERQRALTISRVRALAREHAVGVDDAALRAAHQQVAERPVQVATERIVAGMQRFLTSEECPVPLPEGAGGPDVAARLSRALAALGRAPGADALTAAIAETLARPPDDLDVQDLAFASAGPLEESWRQERAAARGRQLIVAAGIDVPATASGERFRAGVAMAMMDLDAPTAMQPTTADGVAAGTLAFQVNGMPVMHRGLSRSVTENQVRSLVFAVALIVIIMSLLFRSFWTGLMVATPTMLTLLVIYGGMGVVGIRLDIGTSMLASLILGAGVDYAVHLTAAWRAPAGAPLSAAAATAAERSGPAIWTNAIMVAVGFLVLATGEARPLQNVGGLTSAAMIAAAVLTFLAIPVLARRRSYSGQTAAASPAATSPVAVSTVVDAVLGKVPPE